MAMHDDHERAEIRVAAPICGSWVGDQIPAIVDLRRLRAAWLVRPVPIATLSIPMKIPIRPDHQRHKVALFGALVVGSRRSNERVGDSSCPHLGAGDGIIHRPICQPGLRICIGSVVRPVIVAIVVELNLSAIVPP